MAYEYYYAKQANCALLDEQVMALAFATDHGYSGSAWLDPSITPEAGKSLRLSWQDPLTAPQETEVATVVAAHDATQKTQAHLDYEAAALESATELAEIERLGALARAETATFEEVRELAGLMEQRVFG